MNINIEELENFYSYCIDILNHPIYKELDKYIQHGRTTVYEHCFNVAIESYNYVLNKKKKYDLRSLVRGALLHDFFLYDWHIVKGRKRFHGLRHNKIALNNSRKYFVLNKIEENIIYSHMWPLTFFAFPKYKEALIVNRIDKIISFMEHNIVYIS